MRSITLQLAELLKYVSEIETTVRAIFTDLRMIVNSTFKRRLHKYGNKITRY